MARISPFTADEAGEASATSNSLQKEIGMLPNIYASMAHSPTMLEPSIESEAKRCSRYAAQCHIQI